MLMQILMEGCHTKRPERIVLNESLHESQV